MATKDGRDDSRLPTQWIATRWQRFTRWRLQRPFLGGMLLCIAGVLIAWVPMQILPEIIFIGGEMAGFLAIGAAFGVFVFLTGVFALYRPELADVIGVVGVALSILSIFGSLGGLLVGMLLGIIGGNLCLAWKPDDESTTDPSKVDATVARVCRPFRSVVARATSQLREHVEHIKRRTMGK
ncbi:DUF6114 domain-containing protein [Natrinema ejinorense]|uniref:DUF6114 domain-containing protein n=1 Tax=Natrinema ejinorense TaxID=373386 RepID=UPI001FE5C19F|nr:DUF6114 domain-containing protein [Natrinema ejinorense]